MIVVVAVLVALVLAAAIARPHGLPEVAVAAPAAVVVLAIGALSPAEALDQLRALGPTVAFLAAILVLAHLADACGVFRWTAALLRAGATGSPTRLLALVFAACAVTTAVLSLDATVVLLTPAVLATAVSMGVSARPASYASAHLANSASTLMPVSNLTNLLAFSATGLGFAHFTALMALPWVVAIGLEFAVARLFFARELRGTATTPPPPAGTRPVPAPRWALAVLALTLAGFALSGLLGVAPVWCAVAGAALLAVPALREGRTRPRRLLAAADPFFLLFVLALGVVVAPLTGGAVGDWLAGLLPTGESFGALLLMAVVAAAAANLVNNLPATLLLIAALGPAAPTGLLLAMLIGVNLGPNLTYTGSLATMLWRRVVARAGQPAEIGTFTRLGLVTVPLTLVGAVAALWLVTR
ncbi:arsenic transporter [Rhodococcus spelaei]|uniref:Arsenic transporter n=1 Tax=Rhodococcus spelaei TaxID=2546320 RepID=A0A541BMF7_9NOCA|nr:SLC13 family permease [Rhodococcus spelaei]TQF73522.1 arsenic transporter [Rhodococcus spelaei]